MSLNTTQELCPAHSPRQGNRLLIRCCIRRDRLSVLRAAANEAQGKEEIDDVQAVMGNLTTIDFEENADDLPSQVEGLQEAAQQDRVTGDQLQALLKLFATEASKTVVTASESAENKVLRVIAAKDGAVNQLKRSAQQLQQDNDDLALLLKQAKTHPSNISQSEKQFEFQR